MSDMAVVLFPFLKFLGPLKDTMLKVRWDNLEQIKKVTCPILLISGDKDKLTPTEMTRRLFLES